MALKPFIGDNCYSLLLLEENCWQVPHEKCWDGKREIEVVLTEINLLLLYFIRDGAEMLDEAAAALPADRGGEMC